MVKCVSEPPRTSPCSIKPALPPQGTIWGHVLICLAYIHTAQKGAQNQNREQKSKKRKTRRVAADGWICSTLSHELLLGNMTVRRQPQWMGLRAEWSLWGLEMDRRHFFLSPTGVVLRGWLMPPALDAFPVPREPCLTPPRTPVWRGFGRTSDVAPPSKLWGHLLNLSCFSVGTLPLGTPWTCLCVRSHTAPNPVLTRFLPCTSRWLFW